jgi:SsrA-binding protein
MASTGRGDKTVITNRRARHDYFVLDVFEAGMILKGAEVKSIREGRANLQDAFVRVEPDAVRLYGMHVSPYFYSHDDIDPVRPRALLLHQREINELARAADEKGVTIVPLRVYFTDGRAKVEIATARGKARHDKRQALAERDAQRDIERAMKGQRDS